MKTQAESITPGSKSNMPMHAYVVMLHLVSQGYSDFVEIRKVLCRDKPGSYYIKILAHIVSKIERLEEEWRESIPQLPRSFSIRMEVRLSGRVSGSQATKTSSRPCSRSRYSLQTLRLTTIGIKF